MAGRALVTGSPGRVAKVGEALSRLGCEVVAVDRPDQLAGVCAGLGHHAVDHYIQLPVDVPSEGTTVVGRLRAFLDAGLLGRFQAASEVLAALRPDASVVLVSGNLPAELTAPDDRQARISLLRVLAQAILADLAPVAVRVVVMDHTRTPDEIAAAALDPAAKRLRTISDAAERYPDMSYDDWRLEVLRLASIES